MVSTRNSKYKLHFYLGKVWNFETVGLCFCAFTLISLPKYIKKWGPFLYICVLFLGTYNELYKDCTITLVWLKFKLFMFSTFLKARWGTTNTQTWQWVKNTDLSSAASTWPRKAWRRSGATSRRPAAFTPRPTRWGRTPSRRWTAEGTNSMIICTGTKNK